MNLLGEDLCTIKMEGAGFCKMLAGSVLNVVLSVCLSVSEQR